MTIDPFFAGVFFTVSVEAILAVIFSLISYWRSGGDNDDNDF